MIRTLPELEEILEKIPGFEKRVVYRAWQEEKAPPLPYICYLETQSDNFAADGMVYFSAKEVNIELYTQKKDRATERLVEAALESAGIFWESDETYLSEEKMYMKTYEIEV